VLQWLTVCCQVVEVSGSGEVLRSFGAARGSDDTNQLNWPWYLVLDVVTDQCLVADRNNHRVLQLDAQLRPTGLVINSPKSPSGPARLSLAGRKLLVAHSNTVDIFILNP